jgi:TorA maturation chaperone TorD
VSGGDPVDVAAARQGSYELLGRLCLQPPDAALLQALRDVPPFDAGLPGLDSEQARQALRVEHTRLLLMQVHPFESVYLDVSAMLNTPSSGAVLEHYREHGFEPRELQSAGAPDHLGLELLFMAHLLRRERAARAVGQATLVDALRADQRHFLEEHLARWAPVFGRVLSEAAGTQLYQALGQAIEEFVLAEHQRMAGGEAA